MATRSEYEGRRKLLILKIYVAIVAVSILHCSQNFSESGVDEALRENSMTPINPDGSGDTMPESSRPIDTMSTEVDLGGLLGEVPDEWHAVSPSNSMRVAEYHLHGSGDEEDGIIAVFYFGPGQGGDSQANIDRWVAQFQSENAQPLFRQWSERVSGMSVKRLEVSGTYNVGTMSGGSGESLENYMLFGAIVESPRGSYFFKSTGPEVVLQRYRESFERYISSLRPK